MSATYPRSLSIFYKQNIMMCFIDNNIFTITIAVASKYLPIFCASAVIVTIYL